MDSIAWDVGWMEFLSEGEPEPPTDPNISITRGDPDVVSNFPGKYELFEIESADDYDIYIYTANAVGTTINGTIAVTGTAVADTHYNALSTSWSIPSGQRKVAIPFSAINDGVYTGPLTIIVTLQPGSGYIVAGSTLSITRVDAQFNPTAQAGPNRPGQFRVLPPL
jgi:hypothetical protein